MSHGRYPPLKDLEITIDQTAQYNPYTWVRLRTVFHTSKIFAYGFAECGDKDEFNSELGFKIAKGRAMDDLSIIIGNMAMLDEQAQTR